MGRLQRAIEDWIRAEALFRLGSTAYGAQESDLLEEAERKLREAATGLPELREAAESLGVKLAPRRTKERVLRPMEWDEPPPTPPKPRVRIKPAEGESGKRGLFD